MITIPRWAIPSSVYIYGAALVLASGAYVLWRGHERAVGARDVMIAGLRDSVKKLDRALPAERVQFTRDTVRTFRRIHTVDTLIQRIIDTAHVHHFDTVRVAVTTLQAAADTLRGCRVTLTECGTLRAQEQARGDLLARELVPVRKQMPSGAGRWLERGLSAAAILYFATKR